MSVVFLIIGSIFTIALHQSARAALTTTNIGASADNSLDGGGSTTTTTPAGDNEWNKGGQTSLPIGLANGALKHRRALMKFDFSGIPTNAYVSSSTMRLYCNFKWASDATQTVNAYKLSRNWAEGTSADGTFITRVDSTWFHTDYPEQWGTQGADQVGVDRESESLGSATITSNCMTGTGSTGVAGEFNWRFSTTTVQSWIQNASTNYGMVLIGNEVTQSITRHFASRETTTAAFRPSMMVQYDLTPDTPTSLGSSSHTGGSYLSTTTPNLSFTQVDDDAADTTRFHIQIDDASDFLSPVVEYTSALASQGVNSFTVGDAAGTGFYTTGSAGQTLSEGTYYWRVRSSDGTSTSTYAVANSGGIAFRLDTTAPTVAAFSQAPDAGGSTTGVSMTAETATDAGEGTVSYRFTEVSGNEGGTSSDWQSSSSFSDTGLNPCTTYTYVVSVKDGAGNTRLSSSVSTKTRCLGGGAAGGGGSAPYVPTSPPSAPSQEVQAPIAEAPQEAPVSSLGASTYQGELTRSTDGLIYLVQNGTRRRIDDAYTLLRLAYDASRITATDISGLPEGAVVKKARLNDVRLIRYSGSSQLYLFENDAKYPIENGHTIETLGFANTQPHELHPAQSYRTGLPIRTIELPTVQGYNYVTPLLFSTVVGVGSRGDEVTRLQTTLKVLGYFKSRITGYFGPATRQALTTFQKQHRVFLSGVTDTVTQAALNRYY